MIALEVPAAEAAAAAAADGEQNELTETQESQEIQESQEEGGNDSTITQTNELRTSLRRSSAGGSSASGRRVRFSLDPECQSEEGNPNATPSETNPTYTGSV